MLLFAKWIRKDEIIKSLLETQTSILETVLKPSVEEEKEEEEVSSTRNEIIEEIQWQKQSSGKKNKNDPKNIYIGNLRYQNWWTLWIIWFKINQIPQRNM